MAAHLDLHSSSFSSPCTYCLKDNIHFSVKCRCVETAVLHSYVGTQSQKLIKSPVHGLPWAADSYLIHRDVPHCMGHECSSLIIKKHVIGFYCDPVKSCPHVLNLFNIYFNIIFLFIAKSFFRLIVTCIILLPLKSEFMFWGR